MAKQFLYIILTVSVFTSCSQNNRSFTVTGKIKNVSAGNVLLQKLSYQSADFKTVDSTEINKDGTYKLTGLDSQQNLYVVSLKNNPEVILINDANDIKIDFDPNGFHYPDVKKSDATMQLYAFIKNYWQKDSMLALTYHQLDAINKSGSQDSLQVNQLQENYTKQLNALGNVLTDFIKTTNHPAAICFALDKAKGVIAPEALYALSENASKRFPQHSGIAIFKSEITQAMQSQNPGNEQTSDLLNKPAPDLTMTDVNGKKISISDFKGKYLLVDFWASWCAPCRQENPNVVAAYNKFKNKNFAILGVSLDDDKAAWLKAIQDDHLAWTHMSDLQSPSAATTIYQFNGIPFNVLIDPQGKIIAESLRGPLLEQKLSEVLQ